MRSHAPLTIVTSRTASLLENHYSKNRGKRPSAPPAGEAEAEASKRAKLEEEMDPYLKEVQKASSNAALRGEGAPGRTYLK